MRNVVMTSSSAKGPQPTMAPSTPGEATEIHTGILRLALAVEESRAYWSHADPDRLQPPGTPAERALLAFEKRWFGAKTMPRIRFLLPNLAARCDAFPQSLAVLHRWAAMDAHTRRAVCHFHMQLSDPIYRRFTGDFLVQRRNATGSDIDRDIVLRWVQREFPDRWAPATCIQFASKLLSAASEAGLISAKKDPRKLLAPLVPELALAYLLYVLRGLRFEGTLVANPYLASIGLVPNDARLASLPGVQCRRMGDLVDFQWAAPDLSAWADLHLPREGTA
jgi:hypothetical protein